MPGTGRAACSKPGRHAADYQDVTAWPTEIPDSPPPEVLRDLDTAACTLAELDELGVEITLALEPAGLCVQVGAGTLGRRCVLPATDLLDLLVARPPPVDAELRDEI